MKTVITIGGNLYQLAALYLNDATQWNRLAEANNIVPPEPVITGTVTLTIPDIDPNAGGGVYSAQ